MMNTVNPAMCLGLFLICGPSLASDLYRCDLRDGRTVYQSAQCAVGASQKAIDPKNARREQIRRTLQQERELKRQKTKARTTAG